MTELFHSTVPVAGNLWACEDPECEWTGTPTQAITHAVANQTRVGHMEMGTNHCERCRRRYYMCVCRPR
jgi:hypothetical protein